MSAACTATVSSVAETLDTARGVPLKVAVEPVTKLVPVTVRAKPALPATAVLGAKPVMVGTGLGTGAVTVKVATAVVPPPGAGFVTVTS